jgi:hypothetical protein
MVLDLIKMIIILDIEMVRYPMIFYDFRRSHDFRTMPGSLVNGKLLDNIKHEEQLNIYQNRGQYRFSCSSCSSCSFLYHGGILLTS